jgi:FkbM family methyltransferase
MIFHKIANKLRYWLHPSEMEREHRRWLRDQGEEKLRFSYPLDSSSLCLDVGGFQGDWCHLARQGFDCRVEVFEPMPAFTEMLKARFATDAKVAIHPFGLGGRSRTVAISNRGDASSVLQGGEGQAISIRSVSEIFDLHGYARVDLLKINIEGAEYELLEDLLASPHMSKVRYLQVQFHDFVPNASNRMQAIRDRLDNTHVCDWHYRFVWESWRLRTDPAPVRRQSPA